MDMYGKSSIIKIIKLKHLKKISMPLTTQQMHKEPTDKSCS